MSCPNCGYLRDIDDGRDCCSECGDSEGLFHSAHCWEERTRAGYDKSPPGIDPGAVILPMDNPSECIVVKHGQFSRRECTTIWVYALCSDSVWRPVRGRGVLIPPNQLLPLALRLVWERAAP